MKRAIAAALVLLPGAAFGQGYQTALPLSPAEKVALEARLSTVLDYAGSGEATDIVLPTGRVASVRTYQIVRQGARAPCRGYRIDLQGSNGTTAVDGFRCRQAAGAWAIAEPEIVIGQAAAPARPADDVVIIEEGGPLDLRGRLLGNEVTVVVPDGALPDALSRRLPGEPLYPGDTSEFAAPGPAAPPPVPRPAPRGELVAAAAAAAPESEPGVFTPGSTTVDTAGPDAGAEEVAARQAPDAQPAPAATPEVSAVEPPVAATNTWVDEPAAEPDDADPLATTLVRNVEGGTSAIPATTGVSRTVGTSTEATLPDYATDERVRTALEDLDYLDPAGGSAPETVATAVDEFASDERFALPISPDALVERLTAALDRSETVTLCGTGDTPVCRAP